MSSQPSGQVDSPKFNGDAKSNCDYYFWTIVDSVLRWVYQLYLTIDRVNEYYQFVNINKFIKYLLLASCSYVLGCISKVLLLFVIGFVSYGERSVSNRQEVSDLRSNVLHADKTTIEWIKKYIQSLEPYTGARPNNEMPELEQVDWFNELLQHCWPNTEPFLRDKLLLLMDIINQYLQEKNVLGKPLSQLIGLRMTSFHLGFKVPKVLSLRVIRQADFNQQSEEKNFVAEADIVYASDAELVLYSQKFKVGIKDLYVRGKLRLDLGPPTTTMPLMEGVSLYLLEPPQVEFNTINIANTIDMFTGETLSKLVKVLIVNAITELLVMPNSIPVPFVDASSIRCPTPRGAVRVCVVEASDLPDDSLMTSHLYCLVRLGASEYATPIVKNSVNPYWAHWTQFVCTGKPGPDGPDLHFTVMKRDTLRSDSVLLKLRLCSYEIYTNKIVNRTLPDPNPDSRGRLHVKAVWLPFTDDISQHPVQLSEIAALQSGSLSKKEFKEGFRSEGDVLTSVAPIFSCVLLLWLDSATELPISASNWRVEVEAGGDLQRSWSASASSTAGRRTWKQSFIFLLTNTNEQLTIKLRSHEGLLLKSKKFIDVNDLTKLIGLTTGLHSVKMELSNGTFISLHLDLSLKILSPAGELMDQLQVTNKNDGKDSSNVSAAAKEFFKKGKSASRGLLTGIKPQSTSEAIKVIANASTFYLGLNDDETFNKWRFPSMSASTHDLLGTHDPAPPAPITTPIPHTPLHDPTPPAPITTPIPHTPLQPNTETEARQPKLIDKYRRNLSDDYSYNNGIRDRRTRSLDNIAAAAKAEEKNDNIITKSLKRIKETRKNRRHVRDIFLPSSDQSPPLSKSSILLCSVSANSYNLGNFL